MEAPGFSVLPITPTALQIRRYLLQRLQAAEAEAAAAGSSADVGEGSTSEEGGGSASAAAAASAAAFLQLLNETSVRQSDVRLAIRRAAREQGIPQKKVGACLGFLNRLGFV